ncbi:MAG: hypothetical protein U1C57_01975 [Candidatus Doudnabacteria bacterium]|nr:hypothetical protein [Desulfobacterales bacterium]MDZ4243852.1 hypothetical protein [Candidatus Doudnabacteria bacterium]
MPTYLNGYTLLDKVRKLLNEHSTAYVQGTDTTGKYSNDQIMEGINAANRYLYSLLLPRIPYHFEAETTLAGVASVYTLPADFGILRYFKDSDGHQIFPVRPDQRRLASQSGSDQLYYRQGNTLVRDKASITETCTLIYYKKVLDIDQGISSAGGALSLALATSAKKIVDYYNGITIENVTDDWVDTISDYTAARVATIGTETGAASKYYGTVSSIPEPFHFLIIPRAIFEITGNYPVVQEKPQGGGKTFWDEQFLAALKAYAGAAKDTYPEDIWTQYGGAKGGGVSIPGQGYDIR